MKELGIIVKFYVGDTGAGNTLLFENEDVSRWDISVWWFKGCRDFAGTEHIDFTIGAFAEHAERISLLAGLKTWIFVSAWG